MVKHMQIAWLSAVFAGIGVLALVLTFADSAGVISVRPDNLSINGPACLTQDQIIEFGQSCTSDVPDKDKKILIFSETAHYPSVEARIRDAPLIHKGIVAGTKFITQTFTNLGVTVDATDFSDEYFTAQRLAQYDAVVFLSPSGDALNDSEQVAFEKYIQAGGAYVGVHYAMHKTTEPEWDWYEELLGTTFGRVSGGGGDYRLYDKTIVEGTIRVTDDSHPSTETLPSSFQHTDEWYTVARMPSDATVVLALDQASVAADDMVTLSPIHPISWYRSDFQGGKMFYTQLGDNEESFAQSNFQEHLKGAINWATNGTTSQ